MKKFIFSLLFLSTYFVGWNQQPLLQNVMNRNTTSLNGKWNYIIDPYEMGYYDYRWVPYDQNPKPQDRAFYINAKPKDKSERIE